MKKRTVFVVLMIFVLITLTGCPHAYSFRAYLFKYRSDYNELHVVASNSLLSIQGMHNDIIFILDEDDFGRVMFVFVPENASFWFRHGVFAIVIAQKTTETHSYFYSSYNVILTNSDYVGYNVAQLWRLTEEEMFDLAHKVFSQEQIEGLKETNDWNKEINNDRLFQIPIVREKDNDVVPRRIQERLYHELFEQFSSDFRGSVVSTLLTTDSAGNSIYVMQGHLLHLATVDTPMEERFVHSYLVMFDRRNNLIATEQLLYYWHYQEQLRNFKRNNGWNFYSN
jgi:hypothetical protein